MQSAKANDRKQAKILRKGRERQEGRKEGRKEGR
jgi:hypothetical protein